MTLLLVNAAAMEALPLFLDRLVSPTIAIVLSVTAVLFFGERPSPLLMLWIEIRFVVHLLHCAVQWSLNSVPIRALHGNNMQ